MRIGLAQKYEIFKQINERYLGSLTAFEKRFFITGTYSLGEENNALRC